MTERSGPPRLDDLLRDARGHEVPPALMRRVLGDAEALAPRPASARRTGQSSGAFRSRLRAILREIGGWPSVAGFAAASVAGLLIGMAAPEMVFPVAGSADGAGFEIVDLVPGYGIDGVTGN